MITQKINIAMLIYFNVLSLLNLANFIYKNKKKPDVILCYHSCSDDDWRFSTPVADFEQQIKYIVENYRVVKIDKILEGPRLGRPQISITFDDGYEDIYNNAFPIMKRYGVVATVFIIGNYRNRDKEVLDNNKPMLTKKQIYTLKKAGWCFGYHTKTHTSLKKLNYKLLQREIKSSFTYFAYPNGYYNQDITNLVQDSGYRYALTIDGGKLLTIDKHKINRVPMEGKITLENFKALLTPAGLNFSRYFMSLLKIKEHYLATYFK